MSDFSGQQAHPGPDGRPMALGTFYDGHSAWGSSVTVRLGQDALEILSTDDALLASWPFADLHAAGGTLDGWDMRLRADGHPGRLAVHGQAFVMHLRQAVPSLLHEGVFDPQPFRSVLGLMMVLVGAVGMVFFIVIPLLSGGLARIVPGDWERQVGARVQESMIASFAQQLGTSPEALQCTGPAGQQAMDRIVDRLSAGMDLPHPVTVTVLDVDNVNAFALPGGRLLVARGLFNYARSADEVAAVIAHEMVHVAEHHPSRNVIEGGATALLFSVFVGGLGQRPLEFFIGNMLISASHSRHRELDADEGAVSAMAAAGLDPSALATFLERIARNSANRSAAVSWLLTHPVSGARAALVRERVERMAPAPGASLGLSWADLTHLRTMCGDGGRGRRQGPPRKVRKDWRI
ncbi:MAG: M48 family metallopeptidase [Alphaproteobacteria bacterium]